MFWNWSAPELAVAPGANHPTSGLPSPVRQWPAVSITLRETTVPEHTDQRPPPISHTSLPTAGIVWPGKPCHWSAVVRPPTPPSVLLPALRARRRQRRAAARLPTCRANVQRSITRRRCLTTQRTRWLPERR